MKKNTQKELVVDKIIEISKLLDEICEIENEDGELTVNCFSKETMDKNPFPLSLDEFSMDLLAYAKAILDETENSVYLVIETITKTNETKTHIKVFENYKKAKAYYETNKKDLLSLTRTGKEYVTENKEKDEFIRIFLNPDYTFKLKIERKIIE